MGMQQLVSIDWLADRLGSRNLVVLDCTVYLKMGPDGFISESGRDNWAMGQIPSAGFADLNEHLVDTDSPHRYALPSPREFADAMQELGVDNRSRVVLYDDDNSMWAARVWWMLRWIGFDNAAVLDGGLKAWKAAGHPVTTDYSKPSKATLFVHERPDVIADKTEVMAAVEDGATCLIDALPAASFNGDVNIYGRPGHIPTATNASAAALIDEKTGCYLPLDILRDRFPDDESARIVNYCGGGIAASSAAFIQTVLGFDNVAVYTASLQEWANDANAPMTIDG